MRRPSPARCCGEVVGAEQALFLGGDGREQHRAPRFRVRYVQRAGHLQHDCDTDGIVVRAVVDRIAFDRRATAEMIQVRGDHDDLVPEVRVRARQQAEHVRALGAAQAGRRRQRQHARQAEALRFAGVGGSHDLREARRGILEQARAGLVVETKSQFQLRERALRFAVSVEPAHLRSPAHRDHALPRDALLVDRRSDGDCADGAALHERAPLALVPRVVRALRVRKLRRGAAQDHGDAAVEVDVLEVGVVELGSVDAEAGEHQRCGQRRAGREEVRGGEVVSAVLEVVALVLAHEFRDGAGQHRSRFHQRHGLQVRVCVAGRCKAGLAELRRDVRGGNVVAARRCRASFQQIAGEKIDVAADRLGAHAGCRRKICRVSRERRGGQQQGCQTAHGTP